MEKYGKQLKNTYALVIAALTWASLGLQYYITPLGTVNFFSFFTVLCNLLIAACLTFSVLTPKTRVGIFFSDLSIQSAIASYIFIVALVYNLVLRGIWLLTGLGWVLDNMVHVVVPFLYLTYWFFFRPEGTLKWRNGVYWAIFPFAYLAYSLIRGAFVGWYPYPFLHAGKLGYEQVFLNIVVMLGVFIVTGLVIVLMTGAGKKRL